MRQLAILLQALALAACGTGEAPPRPLTQEQSAALRPADARLAELYDNSCRACHTVKDSLAPLTGDRTLWDPRWQQGDAALLSAVLQGKKAMPAGGQCFTCTADDYRALIRFMAGRGK